MCEAHVALGPLQASKAQKRRAIRPRRASSLESNRVFLYISIFIPYPDNRLMTHHRMASTEDPLKEGFLDFPWTTPLGALLNDTQSSGDYGRYGPRTPQLPGTCALTVVATCLSGRRSRGCNKS